MDLCNMFSIRNKTGQRSLSIFSITFVVLLFVLLTPAQAYIGPGAGFAFISSLFTLFITFVVAFFSLLLLPLRILLSFLRSEKGYSNAKVKRVVILGFDGLDPELVRTFMQQGLLPNFSELSKNGTFKELRTTFPSLSPVAWSSFATGVNPAKHRIFDFLHRNPATYLPELSSCKKSQSKKVMSLGNVQIPLGKARMQFLRKSQSFWKVLGKKGIFSHIIRVPITFPPEKFHGNMLSAMCTPDVQGTQGSFAFYTSAEDVKKTFTNGACFPLKKNGHSYKGTLVGPENNYKKKSQHLTREFYLEVQNGSAELKINGEKYTLAMNRLSPWIPVTFKTGLGGKISGICQMLLKSTTPAVQLYVSPIHINPERPAMPISNPHYYSIYLAKLFGRYATAGLAEDTWALNEGILDDRAFLDQVYRYQHEREEQLFHSLKKTRRGLCACVFDATDRIQHTFFRYLDEHHPALKNAPEQSKNAIRDVYQKADQVLGRVRESVSDDTLIMVMSDHGFKAFRRGININSWLQQHGYLVLKENSEQCKFLQNVDWTRTKAYALGLAGIYINRKGRERQGIVETIEVESLKTKLVSELSGLTDLQTNHIAIHTVYDSEKINKGPYAAEAPDLIVGYNPGYRISWDGAVGMTTDTIFEDNTKAWSGDHGIDPQQVPGVLFSNYKIETGNPHIMDIAPTVLSLFGIDKPAYMDGKELVFANLNSNK